MPKRILTAITFMMLLFIFSANSSAVEKSNENYVLKWNYESQKSFLITAISMATAIASQARPDIHKCIGEWYTDDQNIREIRYQELLEAIEKFETYNPTAVVLWVIQEECGTFKQANT